jgi:hypothetical protein
VPTPASVPASTAQHRDLIAGKIVSAPGVMELGQLEDHFAASYLRTIAKGLSDAPEFVQQHVLASAAQDVRDGLFAYGSPLFDRWAIKLSTAPFILWLLLRIEHPQTTLEEAAQFFRNADGARLAASLQDLLGCSSLEPERRTEDPNDYARGRRAERFDVLCARGGLTPSQLVELPIEAVAQSLGEGQPGGEIDLDRLPEWIGEYVNDRR